MSFIWNALKNKETGLSVRTKLNLLGDEVVQLQDQADATDDDLSEEIAVRTGLTNSLQAQITDEIARAIGVEALKADLINGLVPVSQLPSYVDAVLEYPSFADFPAIGSAAIIYVDTSTTVSYRWSGTVYASIGSGLALGITSSNAYRGDFGKIAYDHSQIVSGNPHGTTLAMLGAGDAASKNTGTGAGTVAAGNDSRIVNALQKGNNLSDLTDLVAAWATLGGKAAGKFDTVPIANGGTGAASASAARTALGLGSAAVADINSILLKADNLSNLASIPAALTNLGWPGSVIGSGAAALQVPILVGGVLRVGRIQCVSVANVTGGGSATPSWPTPFSAVCAGAVAVRTGGGSDDRVWRISGWTVNNVTIANPGATASYLIIGFGY